MPLSAQQNSAAVPSRLVLPLMPFSYAAISMQLFRTGSSRGVDLYAWTMNNPISQAPAVSAIAVIDPAGARLADVAVQNGVIYGEAS